MTKQPDLSCTLFVVDDSSPDQTAAKAESAGQQYASNRFKVRVLSRKAKDGFGRAYVHGFKHVLKENFDYILQIDADLSHNPNYIPQFLEAAKTHDFVVGSRYIKGGATPDWSWYRKLLSRGGNLYTRLWLGNTITDYTGGFNLFHADLLRQVHSGSLRASGYGFLIELKHRALQHAKSPTQIPIIFIDRQHGSSKIPKSTIIKNLILVPKIYLQK